MSGEKRQGFRWGEAGRDEASRGDNCQVFDMVPGRCDTGSGGACSSMLRWYQTCMVTCRLGRGLGGMHWAKAGLRSRCSYSTGYMEVDIGKVRCLGRVYRIFNYFVLYVYA